MKAIILAAGMGTRLGTAFPKTMTALVDEKSILDFQIEKIANKIGIDNILVVVGYKKELIMESKPEVMYIYNPNFARTNTGKSLLLALKKVDEDVIFMNGDVYFDEEVLDELIGATETTLLVNCESVSDEEIKYTLNENGYIHELSKQVKDAIGEAVGINKIVKSDLSKIIQELECIEDKDYFEKAFENLSLKKLIDIRPLNISKHYVREIDFESDLAEVREVLSRRIKMEY